MSERVQEDISKCAWVGCGEKDCQRQAQCNIETNSGCHSENNPFGLLTLNFAGNTKIAIYLHRNHCSHKSKKCHACNNEVHGLVKGRGRKEGSIAPVKDGPKREPTSP